MKTLFRIILGLIALLVVQQVAAQIVFYEYEGFHGRTFATNGLVNNLDGTGFNDRASSAIVQSGEWQVCENAYFRGRCLVLRPGQYPSLGSLDMNNRISSVRRIRGTPEYAYAPPPPPSPPAYAYEYYPHHDETLFQADVVAVRAVVGPPEQRCWVEQQQVVRQNQANIPGAIVGGVLGGVLGHQIGSGRGNDWATGIGAVGGAAIGANVNRGTQVYTQDVQRCEAVQGTGRAEYWDVTYVFRGVTHRAQLGFMPGQTITVNGNGEPRV